MTHSCHLQAGHPGNPVRLWKSENQGPVVFVSVGSPKGHEPGAPSVMSEEGRRRWTSGSSKERKSASPLAFVNSGLQGIG